MKLKRNLFLIWEIYTQKAEEKEAAENYIAALKVDPEYDKARKNLNIFL